MRTTLKIALAAAAMVGVGSAGASAAAVTMFNNTSNSVWYTVYGPLGDGLASGCITKGTSKSYTGQGWGSDGTQGTLVYVRGELKQNTNCGGKTLSDTGRGSPSMITSSGIVRTFNIVNGKIRS